jgi:chemotaxis protein histidine kinase CheA
MQFLLENEADIEIMDIFGRTPLEELFCPAYYRPEEEIEENEIVAILKFVLSNYKVSSRVLMILFLKSLQWGNFDYVPTLILNYALEKNDFDVRKSVIKINPKFCDNFKFTIQNLKSTEELQNELLEDEPLIEKTKQKKRKRETKKTQNKIYNHKKETMKNNDHKEEKAKTVKVKPVSTSDKNIRTFQKLPEKPYFLQNTTTYIENLESKNLELKQINEQQKLMLETIENQNLNFKAENKDLEKSNKNLKKKLKKQNETTNSSNQEIHPYLQARYLVENIFQDFFPKIWVQGDLYQSIQNLRKIEHQNLCNALEYCRKAGNAICHLTNRLQFEKKQLGNLNDEIKIAFLTIFQEFPTFTPNFESSLWRLISS